LNTYRSSSVCSITDGVDVSRASAPGCSTWTYALPSRRAVDARSVVARIRECVEKSPARDALGARRAIERARARSKGPSVGARGVARDESARATTRATEKPRRECGDMCRRATLFAAPRRMRALERVVDGRGRRARCPRVARRASCDAAAQRTLATGRKVSRIGIGTMAWGDETRGFGTRYRERDLAAALTRALDRGVTFVDTAEVYGAKSQRFEQSAEEIVARAIGSRAEAEAEAEAFVGTKVFTVPWTNVIMGGGARLTTKSLVSALEASVRRNGGKAYDLASIHFPFPTWTQTALADALAEATDRGLCRAVGVSNYDVGQMTEAHGLLAKRGIALATNQVKYSVLDRGAEKSGLLSAARDLDVAVVAYSPLGGGALQTSADPEIRTLNKLLEFIGAVNGGQTSAQVALNYLVCKGAIPIPSCTSVARADAIADVLEFELGVEDIETIDEKMDYIESKSSS